MTDIIDINNALKLIDGEIARMQKVRELLLQSKDKDEETRKSLIMEVVIEMIEANRKVDRLMGEK